MLPVKPCKYYKDCNGNGRLHLTKKESNVFEEEQKHEEKREKLVHRDIYTHERENMKQG